MSMKRQAAHGGTQIHNTCHLLGIQGYLSRVLNFNFSSSKTPGGNCGDKMRRKVVGLSTLLTSRSNEEAEIRYDLLDALLLENRNFVTLFVTN
jgi:hypothetical protein